MCATQDRGTSAEGEECYQFLREMELERHNTNRKRDVLLQVSCKEDGKLSVKCVENLTADTRVFDSVDNECGCAERTAHEGQCPHAIKLRGGFDSNCFKKRHIRRAKVVGSTN